VHLAQHRAASATASFTDALALFEQTADRLGQAWALNGLGEAAASAGRPADAAARHTAALALALRVGSHQQQTRAQDGLATAHGAPCRHVTLLPGG
jgi:Tetratricopeptide repeat